MKLIATISMAVLVAVAMGAAVPAAMADHATATVSNAEGSSVPGCEETNECFIPYEVTIDVGGEVIWDNVDVAAHTITSGNMADGGPDGVFDSGLFSPGAEFSHTFEEVGEYPYFCNVHPWLEGTVIVQEAAPGGGCLVATAAYGTEMAPQIQRLREIRDQNILSTDAGSSFVTAFNGIYYTFSPTIADIEREHPLIKGAVFIIIQPVLASLHIMEHADTEFTVIVYGMLVILLNVIMYVIAPVLATAWLLKIVAKRGTFRESLRHMAKAR